MKIQKYVKTKTNKYKVVIDDESYELYDDIIVKYGLLYKSEIDTSLLDEIINDNNELKSYYDSIKYITKKLRSEKEIWDYLKKKEISDSIINKTIKKLKANNFLNNEIYIKSFINDQINLTNNGPKKIKTLLIKNGFDEVVIQEKLDLIDSEIWISKVNNYIDKKIKLNHNNSAYVLKSKIQNELINLGYEKSLFIDYLMSREISDASLYEKEYNKAKRVLEKKYEGKELEYKIKEKLYRKGFKVGSYEE